MIHIIEIQTIISFRTHKNQVIAIRDGEQFKLKERLYELEENFLLHLFEFLNLKL